MTDTAAPEYRSIWKHLMRTPFRQDWVDVDGVSTRYIQAGRADAPVLIMLHGTAGSHECFAPTIEAHAEHFNCYAIDMVGNGFSDKPDIDYEIPVYAEHALAFMRTMGIERASFIGVSLGAWAAARLAVDHPEAVEKLVLLAPSGMIVNNETMGAIKGRRTKAVDDPSWENIRAIFNGIIHDEANRLPDLIAIRQAVYRLPDMKAAMLHILCLQEPDVRTRNLISEDEWRSIKAPTLLVAAPDDNPDYYKTAYAALDLIPDAKLIEMAGVKHWGQFEKPEVFNPASIEFLRG